MSALDFAGTLLATLLGVLAAESLARAVAYRMQKEANQREKERQLREAKVRCDDAYFLVWDSFADSHGLVGAVEHQADLAEPLSPLQPAMDLLAHDVIPASFRFAIRMALIDYDTVERRREKIQKVLSDEMTAGRSLPEAWALVQTSLTTDAEQLAARADNLSIRLGRFLDIFEEFKAQLDKDLKAIEARKTPFFMARPNPTVPDVWEDRLRSTWHQEDAQASLPGWFEDMVRAEE